MMSTMLLDRPELKNTTSDITIEIARKKHQWEDCFGLVAERYVNCCYVPQNLKYRFTPHHTLPDTSVIYVHSDSILMTCSLVLDNILIGLPMEKTFPDEIAMLRTNGYRLGEVTCYAASSTLEMSLFLPTFLKMISVVIHTLRQLGGDAWVFTVNPKHWAFYLKVLKCRKLTEISRQYEAVQGFPAKALLLTEENIKEMSPEYRDIINSPPYVKELTSTPIPDDLCHYFSVPEDKEEIENILHYRRNYGSPRRW